MKKLIALLLVTSCLFCLLSCSIFGGNDYEAKDKTFEFEGLKITLTNAFFVDEQSSELVWYESSSGQASVSIDKYPLSDSDKEMGLDAMFLAEAMRGEGQSYENVSEIKTDNGLLYFECEVEPLGYEFLYFYSFYQSEDALWMVCLMCDLEDYDIYREYFIKWARSVVLP